MTHQLVWFDLTCCLFNFKNLATVPTDGHQNTQKASIMSNPPPYDQRPPTNQDAAQADGAPPPPTDNSLRVHALPQITRSFAHKCTHPKVGMNSSHHNSHTYISPVACSASCQPWLRTLGEELYGHAYTCIRTLSPSFFLAFISLLLFSCTYMMSPVECGREMSCALPYFRMWRAL